MAPTERRAEFAEPVGASPSRLGVRLLGAVRCVVQPREHRLCRPRPGPSHRSQAASSVSDLADAVRVEGEVILICVIASNGAS
jgi:hypothetical protein